MIIAVNTQLLLKDKLEGIGWFAHETLKRITQQHPEHTFYFIFDRQYSPDFIYGNNVKPIILHPQSRHPLLWILRFELLLPKLLKKIKADVYYSPDGWLTTNKKVKTVNVIHDLSFFHNKNDLPYLYQKYVDFFFPIFAKNASKICTVSEYSKKDISKNFNIESENIQVVYNGANEIYKPISKLDIIETQKRFTNNNEYFVYVGAINPRKNLINLFKAFDHFKENNKNEVKLLIVGAKQIWRKEIEDAYLSMRFKNDVIFTGRVSNEDLHHILASSIALTYVSFFEGFGIPLLEAMNCEVPIITSNTTSMPEVAGDAALLVDPNSINEIAKALSTIYSDEDLRNQLIAKGKIQRENFSWQKSADLVWKAIQDILDKC
ncbi:MAG: glycosyltransferase family 1 protein [Bacteroidota bacterium]